MAEKYLSKLVFTEELNSAQLKKITEHKYSSEGSTILDPFFQVFWRWLVEQIPLTWAPNALTIAGLLLNIISTLILVYYCPTATEVAPRWAYYSCALGIFLYQSLDAIDGKQARRTNTSTPLGELFDHGCDAVSTVYVAIAFSISVQLGYMQGWLFFCFFTSLFAYYCAHWQTYVTGSLRFGDCDVTEAQLSLMIFHFVSGTFGPHVWAWKVFGVQLKVYVLVSALIAAILAFFMNFSLIAKGGVGKNKSTVADTSVISPFFNICTIILLAVAIMLKSESGLFKNHPCIYFAMFGMVFSKITIKLVIACMAKSPLDYLDTTWIAPGMLFLNQYVNFIFPEYWVLWIALVYSTFDLIHYSIRVLTQISDHLGIYCFDITKKKPVITTSKKHLAK